MLILFPMSLSLELPPCVKIVSSFHELATTPFADGINALCWPRVLEGDFVEVAAALGAGEGIVTLEEEALRGLKVSAAGRLALDAMLEDLRLLQERELDPVLNCIHGYERDTSTGPVVTDVISWHVDTAPVEADTWLCTYLGPSSEGLRSEEARRKVEVPEIREALLREFGGPDGETFLEYLAENCYDLHYAPLPGAVPYVFGLGHLWRIAADWPGIAVPPCIHRAPETLPGDPPRLLLIS